MAEVIDVEVVKESEQKISVNQKLSNFMISDTKWTIGFVSISFSIVTLFIIYVNM